MFCRAHAQERVVHARVCTDLYDTFFGSTFVSYGLKFQISWTSELWLRRYLQNIMDFSKTIIFNVFSQKLKIKALQHTNLWKIYKPCWNFWKPFIKMSEYHSLHRVPPGRSNKVETYFSSVGSPCNKSYFILSCPILLS